MRGDLWMNIRNEYLKGLSISEISRKYNIDWRTAKKYAKTDNMPKYNLKINKTSKLDRFKNIIDDLLEEAPYSSVRIYDTIAKQGFDGKIGIVRNYVSGKKGNLNTKATARFETLPGKQGQVDWGHFGSFVDIDGKERKLYCFFMILGYSRMRYIEFVTDMSTTTLIQCHLNAFEYFGGYPDEILYDNMKQVVVKRLMKQEDSKLNPLFEDFAGFYGFKPILCRPYRGQTKGKVERTVRFVRDNFFMGIKFENLDNLNRQAMCWYKKVNSKVHSTINEIPSYRLKSEYLNENIKRYVINKLELRKVEKDCLISFRSNKYSVPPKYIGKEVAVKTNNNVLKVYHNDLLITTHNIPNIKNQMIIKKEHYDCISINQKTKYSPNTLFDVSVNDTFDILVSSKLNELDNIFGEVLV